MPVIGMVGGMSWHSTALYYRLLNEISERRHGRRMNAESIVVSMRFASLMTAMAKAGPDHVAHRIADAARQAERAGAGCILLTAFTAHFAADTVRSAIGVPLFDAGDALAAMCLERGFVRVGLVGTALTLKGGQIAARLHAHGIHTLCPNRDLTGRIDTAIAEDLTRGLLSARSGEAFDAAVEWLAQNGAQAVALVCTELPLLLPRNAPVPLIDGVEAHVVHVFDTLENDE